ISSDPTIQGCNNRIPVITEFNSLTSGKRLGQPQPATKPILSLAGLEDNSIGLLLPKEFSAYFAGIISTWPG
ncbi:TPA: hypothetical protein ACN61L_004360, partial [Klebsiella michiganensis]